MAGEDIIMLSQKELKRLHVIEKVREGAIKQASAAPLLSLSTRQIRRLLSRVREEGPRG
jgi:predicted HTH domain antitoxin